ncbi:MAG TPA: hypothetical protein VL346_03850 [Acidobacteriaceae bacterium]|jgi:hypothetical protein|nr:hypothetical protein [Acidobacteriaceae bacterium]
MNAYAGPGAGFNDYGRSRYGSTLDAWLDRAAAEIRHAVAYVDQVIVPEVRHETGGAMRTVAVHLERWADKLDPHGVRER